MNWLKQNWKQAALVLVWLCLSLFVHFYPQYLSQVLALNAGLIAIGIHMYPVAYTPNALAARKLFSELKKNHVFPKDQGK